MNLNTPNRRLANLLQSILSKLGSIELAINQTSLDEQAILSSIDSKLNELALIKAELIEANTTLVDIETNTDTANTKLDTVITKLDSQITELQGIKLSIDTGNIKLDEIFAKLEDILVSIDAIKVDIADIKIDIAAIKTSVASIDTKLSTVITSLSNIETKLDTIHSDLTTINTTLQTEFDQTQVKLDAINATLESALTLFQSQDCAGNDIGTAEVVLKAILLNKVVTSICNVQELADAINAGQPTATGKAHDVNSIVMTVGQTISIPSGHFSTLVFHAAKGEFKIENTSNDHSTIFTTTGTVSKFIEISEDGLGTATGSTNAPMTMDTRSNANDLAITNTYTVTAVRAGVLKLETYK